MTDTIQEQLRMWSRGEWVAITDQDLVTEAADEIDRLERELAEAKAAKKILGESNYDLCEKIIKKDKRIEELMQIVMAVETKHPGEERWETALRYVREAENRPLAVAAAREVSND